MGLISLTLPNDGETIDAADVNSPLNTIATAINGNLDNANIKTAAAIDGSKIADNSIPNTKMINAPLGWTAFGNTPNTVTYNGNRNYDLVFNSVDLTSSLSPGMKLQLTRTVAAPDQCADLEASSSQYFNKTSPNKLTFTDDFTVSAWVKLESYAAGTIVSRYNGTSGWYFDVNSSGQLRLVGLNAGAANYSLVQSYASLPLNKWVHISAQLDMSTFTATSSTSYIMFDGVDTAASVSRSGTNPTALVQAGNLEIGSANATTFFDGKIAQVAIFNAKVNQATMRGYMSQGLSGSETSLASAFSLDNSIADLNTTTPNDLTAQNSAAATNADSPFANAVSAGLLEYAEINAVSFSTNTTVNVRVPDTCMIPTSGGVSAVSYSTQSNPYGLPYISKVLGYAQLCSSPTATTSTSTVAIPGLATTFYAPANAKLKITICDGASTSNTTANALTILVGTIGDPTSNTNRVVEGAYQAYANGATGQIYREGIYIPTVSGSLTAYMGYRVSANTSGHSCDTTRPMYLKVELV